MEPKKKRSKLTYVIASHPKYRKALTILLDSIYAAGVERNEIIIVLSEYDDQKSIPYKMEPGVRFFPIKNNIFEYGAHIGIIDAIEKGCVPRTNDFVVIHDTCIVGREFKKRCQNLADSFDEKIIWATEHGNFNLGIYRYEAVRYICDMLCWRMSMDKHFAIRMEHNQNYMSLKRMPISQKFIREHGVLLEKKDVYKEGRERDVSYLNSMDLKKVFLWVEHGTEHPNVI